MMSEVKSREQKGGANKEARKTGWQVGAVVGIGVAAVAAALLFQKCSSQGGQDRPAPPPCVQCESAPVKGDNRCEVEKGEHDPLSPTWDPQSCGYCGDGNRQPFEISSRDPRAAQAQPASGPRLVVCDADFHYCGNGRKDDAAQYAVMVPPESDGGLWSFGLSDRPAESCRRGAENYCEADCAGSAPAPADTGRRTERRTERPDRPDRPAQPGRAGPCDAGVSTSTFSARARDNLTGNSGAVRNAVGAQPSQAVTVRVSITVGPDGRPTVTGASASCAGCSGGDVRGMINLAGLATTAPGEQCSTGFTVVIPPG